MTSAASSAWKRLLAPGLATLVVLALLLALGTWQLRRLAWKEALIAQVEARTAMAPQPAPGPAAWPTLDLADFDFAPVTIGGTFLNDREAHLYGQLSAPRGPLGGVGWFVYAPLRTDEGWIVYVNRGFVPDGRQTASTRREGQTDGHVTITGLARRPETPWRLLGGGSGDGDQWFAREPARFAAAAGLPADEVAPYSIDADATPNPGGLPQGGETVISFPNNHLQYAMTWYGLAIGLVGVFIAYARGVLKGKR